MKIRLLPAVLLALALGLSRPLFAADSGYKVVLELQVDEKGNVEDAKVDTSEDTSVNRILDQISMDKAHGLKLAPRLKDGQPVKYTVKAPFVYPIEGDEGALANEVPKPRIRKAVQPVYPADLAAQGEVGAAILEAVIGTDGSVKSLKILRSTNSAFADAATVAVKQWSFSPALEAGNPIESRWRLSICFSTDAKTPDWKWEFAPRPSLGNYTVLHHTLAPTPPAPVTPAPAGK